MPYMEDMKKGTRKCLNKFISALQILVVPFQSLIFFLIEEEVLLAGIVGPDLLYAFVDLAVILKVFQILNDLQRGA